MNWNEINKKIFSKIKKYLKDNYNYQLKKEDFELSRTKNIEQGDLSTNIALRLSKSLKKSPFDISQELEVLFIKNKLFKNVEAVQPGFINFYLSDIFFNDFLTYVVESKSKYGSDNKEYKKQVINYEFISANPTGELHVGHIRNGVIGDTTCRILEFLGNDVTRGYYMNDLGVQIYNLGKSTYYHYLKFLKYKNNIEIADYNTPEIIEFAKEIALKDKDKYIPSNMEQVKAIEKFKKMSLNHFSKIIKTRIKQLGIKPFDEWYSEKAIFNSDTASITLNHFKKTNASYQKDGATWLKTTKYGDEKDRVMVKSDGEQTYFLPDITNHYLKFKDKRKYDLVIDLFGGDHHGYEKRMIAAIDQLGFDANKFRIDFIQMVLVKDGDEVVKMSKRKGTSVRAIDLIDSIGKDLIRFFITDRSREQQLEINLEQIREKSFDNPYYNMQYSYARAYQVLQKTKKTQVINENIEYNNLIRKIIIQIFSLNKVLISASKKDEPFILNNYLRELASDFNKIYSNNKFIKNNTININHLNLVKSFIQVYEISSKLLSIDPIKKM